MQTLVVNEALGLLANEVEDLTVERDGLLEEVELQRLECCLAEKKLECLVTLLKEWNDKDRVAYSVFLTYESMLRKIEKESREGTT